MPDDPLSTHHPKTEFVVKHKVVKFGDCYSGEAGVREEQKLFYFRHQRADLKVSEGTIPVGFLSQFWLDEGHPIYLDTRYGGYDYENARYIGPEYMISWRKEKETLPPVGVSSGTGDVGWSNNLDDLWISVLSYFERKNVLSEDSLDYLDADPFVLFGLDDHVTQQALKKTAEVSSPLLCIHDPLTHGVEPLPTHSTGRPFGGLASGCIGRHRVTEALDLLQGRRQHCLLHPCRHWTGYLEASLL